MFKKGMNVVQILSCAGVKTASIKTVVSVKKGVVSVADDEGNVSNATFNTDGQQRSESMYLPGVSNEIVVLES